MSDIQSDMAKAAERDAVLMADMAKAAERDAALKADMATIQKVVEDAEQRLSREMLC